MNKQQVVVTAHFAFKKIDFDCICFVSNTTVLTATVVWMYPTRNRYSLTRITWLLLQYTVGRMVIIDSLPYHIYIFIQNQAKSTIGNANSNRNISMSHIFTS